MGQGTEPELGVGETRQTTSVVLRLMGVTRAKALLMPFGTGRDPEWAEDYPSDGDREAATVLLRETDDGRPPGLFGPYEILDPTRGLVVGGAGFHAPPGQDGVVEVGYGVVDSEANNGYATAALIQMLCIAREHGVREARARALPTNTASRRVMEKAGMSFSGLSDGYACYRIDL